MELPNPWKAARQRRKAAAVSALIWAGLSATERVSPKLAETVADMDQETRRGWAFQAGVSVLSETSWSLVVENLQERGDLERWSDQRWADALDDHRAVS